MIHPLPPPAPGGDESPAGPVIGVFDSGVGGLSILRALHDTLPTARLLYVADSGHAPYGEREAAWVRRRSQDIAGFLRSQAAHLLVMACNTATAAAADELRAAHPDWPIVGIEPAVKPAVALSQRGCIGVMATAATLASGRFARLTAAHSQGAAVVTQPCTGLAWAIETDDAHNIQRLIEAHTSPLRAAGVDVVVLGCTHYPFVADRIGQALGPAVTLLDTADPVARRTAEVLRQQGWTLPDAAAARTPMKTDPTPEQLAVWTSGVPAALDQFASRWLNWSIRAQPLPAGSCGPVATEPDPARRTDP